jgi:pimeloyl-ACP methyl ester carboxylesterase
MRAVPFEVITPDGLTLRGESWPGGPDWVLMVHDLGRDLDCWTPLVGPLHADGYSVAAIDLRGHGASDGEPSEKAISSDLTGLLVGARKDAAGLLVLIAAGVPGAVALASNLEPRPDALVLFTPSPRGQAKEDLRGEGTSKLFFVGAADPDADRVVSELRNSSIGHAGVISFPTASQGADLLQTPWLIHVVEQVIGFLDTARFQSAKAGEKGGTE